MMAFDLPFLTFPHKGGREIGLAANNYFAPLGGEGLRWGWMATPFAAYRKAQPCHPGQSALSRRSEIQVAAAPCIDVDPGSGAGVTVRVGFARFALQAIAQRCEALS